MRGYWLKILLGALAVFAVGMIAVSAFDHAKHNVEAIADGNGPISIRLAFLPFKVDGQKLGTFRRVMVFRDSARQPTRAQVTISVPDADSAADARIGGCILAIETREQGSGQNVNPFNYRCLAIGDTGGLNLVSFGDLEIQGREGSFKLYAPKDQLDEVLHRSSAELTARESAARIAADSAREHAEATADSIRRLADSVHQAALERADSALQAGLPKR